MGADTIGIAPAILPEETLPQGPKAYEEWVAAGMHGTMGYMARDPDTRADITRWFKPAKSVILMAFSYGEAPVANSATRAVGKENTPPTGRIARYALSDDYHRELRAKLKTLLAKIVEIQPGARGKIFVDTSPVLERLYSRYAGIGWVGKNTLIISNKIGSFFFLAGLAVDQQLVYDDPMPDHCGSCTRCLDACPTDAFPSAHVLNASKCVAYFTIEHRGPIPEGFREGVGNWVFGCDICQEVCPWNRFSVVNDAFKPKIQSEIPLERLASLSEEEFQRDLKSTPLERAGRDGLARNALLAMGNSKNPSHRQTLERLAENPDPVLSEQASWSLRSLKKAVVASLCCLILPVISFAYEPTETQDTPQGPSLPTTIPPGLNRELSKEETQPWYIQAVMEPIQGGMFLHLPVVDTDPNRGTTYGIMPIWVTKGSGDRIEFIQAPSLTYNRTFRVTPTYRFYYYPTRDAALHAEASYSQVSDRNLEVEYDDYAFLGHPFIGSLKVQYNVDGSNRFFGIGPDTPLSGQSNYKQRTLMYKAAFGFPAYPDSRWKWVFSNEMSGDKISDGPIASLPGIQALYPDFATVHRHQDAFIQASLNYDSRDSPITTSHGSFANFSAQTSQRDLASEYTYQRYGADLRYFYQWPQSAREVTASNLYFDQVIGGAPFWVQPQLGGKYVFRAYGTGRYIDNGLLVANVEQRITVDSERLAGVTTEFQVAPFMGLGSVFDTPSEMTAKYYRPVYGTAFRAIAKPQVVGSVDLGIGQEGLAAFMDINYSF